MAKSEYTKDNIKNRMFSRMAALWDIRSIDNLDPVVKLLVESLASEIFKLTGEMDNIEGRIVEKLARAFTPSFMMSASPAHAVIHARAISGKYMMNANTEFVYKDPYFIQKHNLRKLVFSPVCDTAIINGDVKHMVSGGRFYNVTPRGGKDHVANSLRRDPVFNNTVWIGLEVGEEVTNLDNLSFYFELPFMDNSHEYFRILEHGRWTHGEKVINTSAGIRGDSGGMSKSRFGRYDERLYMTGGIADKYKKQFITVCDDLAVQDLKKETLPQELVPFFDNSFISGLQNRLIWIKIVLPSAFNDNVLGYLNVHINCLPVANIFRKTIITTITPVSSIIPLEKEDNEYLLYMDSVTDPDNKVYKEVRRHDDNNTAGTYIIRRGGCERFNSINARDYLVRLLDLYRDESTAFSKIDKDIANTAEGLMSYLNEFDKKLQSYENDSEHTSYLILGSNVAEKMNLTVGYCLTNGAVANEIRASEVLSVPEAADINPSSVVLMTATRGGMKSPSESSRKDIYQYLFTSRDRIYTNEDMKLFCKCNFGDYFSRIDIEKGYEISNVPKEGIIKTTNVVLYGTKVKDRIESEILIRDILAGLVSRSPEKMNYRVILK